MCRLYIRYIGTLYSAEEIVVSRNGNNLRELWDSYFITLSSVWSIRGDRQLSFMHTLHTMFVSFRHQLSSTVNNGYMYTQVLWGETLIVCALSRPEALMIERLIGI